MLFRSDQIMRLMAYIIWPALLAPVLAPLIGGVITTYAGWRWLFLINVPLGATAFLCCLAFVHAAATDGPPPLDRRGVALTCGGLALLTVSAQVASEAQPRWTLVALAASTAAVLLALAARHLLAPRRRSSTCVSFASEPWPLRRPAWDCRCC